jgi:hypothetical protein
MKRLLEMENSIKVPWINLYELYVGRYSPNDDDRGFRAFTGVPPEVAELVYQRCRDKNSNHLSRTKLLMVLNYLKLYPTEDVGMKSFNINSRKTYRKYIKETIFYLDCVMDEISLDDLMVMSQLKGFSKIYRWSLMELSAQSTNRRNQNCFAKHIHQEEKKTRPMGSII